MSGTHVHPIFAKILEAYVPEPKDIDINREAVDRMIDDLWQYGTVIGKKPTAQDATCHHAADMVDALRIALTAETEELRRTREVLLRTEFSLTAAESRAVMLRQGLDVLMNDDTGDLDFVKFKVKQNLPGEFT